MGKKWRKLPFHVDIDDLPDKFYCKDNIWNPDSNSCSKPEDVWDEEKDEKNIKIEQVKEEPGLPGYAINAKFDVMQPKNKKFTVGVVIGTDITKNRVKFHFPHIVKKRNTKLKEWIKVPSYRVAPLGQYTKSS